jgi:hypothetical protein
MTPCPDLGGAFALGQTERDILSVARKISIVIRCSANGSALDRRELDFKQCSFHHLMQVLRGYSFSTFSLSPAFPPCYCPLAFRHEVRRLTYRISSESYPGIQVCGVRCHGADEFGKCLIK